MSRPLKIAIADDEPEVLQYFAQLLTSCGHNVVVTAANGRELVQQCRDKHPDLLITDIRMDELSGIDAMKELARDAPLPTILISAHYEEEELRGELDGQVVAFLPKPVKMEKLKAAVDQAADRIA